MSLNEHKDRVPCNHASLCATLGHYINYNLARDALQMTSRRKLAILPCRREKLLAPLAKNQSAAAYLRALQLTVVFAIVAGVYIGVMLQWSSRTKSSSESIRQWMPGALGGGKRASRKLH
jgi:hypothetical protein